MMEAVLEKDCNGELLLIKENVERGDMPDLVWILASTGIVSLLSLIGIVTLLFTSARLNLILYILVALSAGGMMGGAFFHLLPEALSQLTSFSVFVDLLIGFSLFFLLERLILWRHCHNGACEIHPFTYLNLIGDCVHNFIDGFVIAASYLVDIHVGIVTTFAIILHEIPHEFGNFGVLVFGGFKPTRALFLNFLTALLAIAGAFFGYFLSHAFHETMLYVLPFTAGNFIYVASTDLVPELHKEPKLSKSLLAFSVFILGLVLMALFKILMEA
jgi:zinc and cadmium transporter